MTTAITKELLVLSRSTRYSRSRCFSDSTSSAGKEWDWTGLDWIRLNWIEQGFTSHSTHFSSWQETRDICPWTFCLIGRYIPDYHCFKLANEINLGLRLTNKLKKHITLLTYLLPCALSSGVCTSHEFMKLRNCWTFDITFSRVQLIAQLMESASWRLRTDQRTF